MAAISQNVGHVQFLKIGFFSFLNSTILEYGRQGAIFKHYLIFYNMAAIFKL